MFSILLFLWAWRTPQILALVVLLETGNKIQLDVCFFVFHNLFQFEELQFKVQIRHNENYKSIG